MLSQLKSWVTRSEKRNAAESAADILARWEIRIAPEGMVLRPRTTTVGAEDMRRIAERIIEVQQTGDPMPVTFDFSGVNVIGPQWTIVLAFLVNVARRCSSRCRIVGLQGQPAAAADLYCTSRGAAALVASQAA
jgi:hypothetical protein